MPRARAGQRVDEPGLGLEHALLREPSWDLLEELLHQEWGHAKLRGYSREEKLTLGSILSVAQRLRDRHAGDRARQSTAMDPHAEEPLLKYFRHEHLPEHLQEASRMFGEVAQQVVFKFPRNPERTVVLRKLLEAKDAAVRCNLP